MSNKQENLSKEQINDLGKLEVMSSSTSSYYALNIFTESNIDIFLYINLITDDGFQINFDIDCDGIWIDDEEDLGNELYPIIKNKVYFYDNIKDAFNIYVNLIKYIKKEYENKCIKNILDSKDCVQDIVNYLK